MPPLYCYQFTMIIYCTKERISCFSFFVLHINFFYLVSHPLFRRRFLFRSLRFWKYHYLYMFLSLCVSSYLPPMLYRVTTTIIVPSFSPSRDSHKSITTSHLLLHTSGLFNKYMLCLFIY